MMNEMFPMDKTSGISTKKQKAKKRNQAFALSEVKKVFDFL